MNNHQQVIQARPASYGLKKRWPSWRISPLTYFIAAQFTLLGGISLEAQARESFNPALLEVGGAPIQDGTDLSLFEDGVSQAPGIYRVDIFLNNEPQETREVEFKLGHNAEGAENLQPCLSVEFLKNIGIKTDLFPALGSADAQCANLSAIPQASAEFRFNAQQLLLSVPQAALSQVARGTVPENQWDEGLPALLLNYSLSGASTQARHHQGSNSNSQFANLRPGINLGAWRLRNYSTWNRDNEGQSTWKNVYNYASRDIRALKSQLVLGDSSSPSDVFDSVPFRGAQIASDDDMIPDSLKGYAPVIRGIARTNAQVVIRQNGYVIYQSFVAPGAFEITDMYPTGGSGNLFVTIRESDGSEQQLVVPYASLPVLQREGRLKYAVTGGQYRSYDSNVEKTSFGQATAIYGLPYGLTAYGGGQLAGNTYSALAVGMGKNLGDFGALSVDVTQAWSTMQDQPQDSGQSWRIRYSKNFVQTGTNFAIAGYRYSTDGYYSLQEILDTQRNQNSVPLVERRRNRSELTMNQNLWEGAGAFSLSWISEDYWNSNRKMQSAGVGYSNSWNGISYGLNYSYNRNAVANGSSGSGRAYDKDQLFSLNISIPLERWMKNTYVSYGLNSSQNGGSSHSASLSGTALANNNLSWGVQQGYGNRGVGNSGNLNADYRGTYGQVNASYGYDRYSQRVNYGVQGGIIAHENGITLGQSLGETVTLVKAPGAKGVAISNQTGVKTDWRGYAIVPYASPYRKNSVQLNTETLPDNVELALSNRNVVPTRGAVVRAEFDTSVGQRVLMTLLRSGGALVPFGATVSDPMQQTSQGFIVGDQGQVYLSGLAQSGTLQVKWGNGTAQQCQVTYTLEKPNTSNGGVQILNGQCL